MKRGLVGFVALLLVLAACGPAGAPQAPPAAEQATAAAPAAQPAEATAPATPAVSMTTSGQIKISALSDMHKKALNEKIAVVKEVNARLSSKIDALIAYAGQKNYAALLLQAEKLKKLYGSNTVSALLDKIDEGIDAGDESIDENTVRLREEMDAVVRIVLELEDLAFQTDDPDLVEIIAGIVEDVSEEQEYLHSYIVELEQDAGVDLEQDAYYDAIEDAQDKEIEHEYGVTQEELDEQEALQEGMFFAEEAMTDSSPAS